MAERNYHEPNKGQENEESQPYDVSKGIYQRAIDIVSHPIEASRSLLEYISDHNPLSNPFQGPHSH